MRILITGGAGFIGSHLAEHLLTESHTVVAVDDLSTGSVRNLLRLQKNRDFRLVAETILDHDTMDDLVEQCDLVYHLAAAVGVKLIVNEPVRTIQTNIRGTEIMLELANKWRKPILLTSTSEVYGKNTKSPFSEDDDMVLGSTRQSRWSYACSKAIDEFLAIAYHRKTGLPVITVRLFNTVGPRQTSRYGMVLPTFVRQALRNEAITVYGDGEQSRTFTYVTDVVRVLGQLPLKEEAFGEVFNVGGNQEISIRGLADLVKVRTKSTSQIVFVPYDQAYAPGFEDMPRRVPDISKIRRIIGYEPRIGLEEIVDRVIEYFRNDPDLV
ncbi:MAG: GDP-mannose 4,6-dehydratase [Pseudomonadota bacterium]